MTYTCIPDALFEAPEYKEMCSQYRAFLIDLYYEFSDCATFRYVSPTGSRRRVVLRHLVKAGLLVVAGQERVPHRGKPPHLYKFRYESIAAYEVAR